MGCIHDCNLKKLIDDETKALLEHKQLSIIDAKKLANFYVSADSDQDQGMSLHEFHEVLDEPESGFLTDLLVQHGFDMECLEENSDYKKVPTLTFKDFVLIVSIFSMFNEFQIHEFVFSSLDSDLSNDLTFVELKNLIDQKQRSKFLKKKLREYDSNQDGSLDFDEFHKMCKNDDELLWPVFRLQHRIQERTLGYNRWMKIREKYEEKYGKEIKGGVIKHQIVINEDGTREEKFQVQDLNYDRKKKKKKKHRKNTSHLIEVRPKNHGNHQNHSNGHHHHHHHHKKKKKTHKKHKHHKNKRHHSKN